MPQFTLDIPNLAQLEAKLTAAPMTLNKIMGNAVADATTMVRAIEKSKAPVRSGRLRTSISQEVSGLTGVVYLDLKRAEYGAYVVGGTGLYGPNRKLIRPKNAKVLATKQDPGFGSKNSGGYYVIGKYSMGQRPNKFIEYTHRDAKPKVMAIMAAALEAAVKAI